MVGLVDYHGVGELGNAFESVREAARATKIRVAESARSLKSAPPSMPPMCGSHLRKSGAIRFYCRLWCEKYHALILVNDQALDQHEATKVLPSPTPSQRNAPRCWRAIFINVQYASCWYR